MRIRITARVSVRLKNGSRAGRMATVRVKVGVKV